MVTSPPKVDLWRARRVATFFPKTDRLRARSVAVSSTKIFDFLRARRVDPVTVNGGGRAGVTPRARCFLGAGVKSRNPRQEKKNHQQTRVYKCCLRQQSHRHSLLRQQLGLHLLSAAP